MERALVKATKDSAVHGVDKNQYLLCSSVVKADERNYYTVKPKVLQTGLDESQAKAAALALLSQQYPQLAAGGGTASGGPDDTAEKQRRHPFNSGGRLARGPHRQRQGAARER